MGDTGDAERRGEVPGRRRTDEWGRPVFSRGPVIRRLEWLTLASSVLALLAIIATGVFFFTRLSDVQDERWRSLVDTCYAIRVTAIKAVGPSQQRYIHGVLRDAGLGDCVGKANRLTGRR